MKNTKMLVLIVLLIALAAAFYRFWGICLTFAAAMIIAYLLGPAARFVARKLKLSHGLSVAMVVAAFVLVLIVLLSISVPYAINQVTALVRDISLYAGRFDGLVQSVYSYLSELSVPQAALDTFLSFISGIDTYILGLFTSVLQGLISLSMGIFDLIIVVILVIYFMLDGSKLMNAFLAALPRRLRESVGRITREANLLTKKYIRTRVLVSAAMAVVTYIGLLILGIRYALLFALLHFVLNFIPYFGSIAAAVIDTVYALIVLGPGKAVAVFIFVLVVQQVEGNVISPRVEGEATGIHPVTVIFALLACNQLFGPVGMLISTPLAAITKAILKEAYRFVVTPDGYDPDQISLE